MTDRNLTPQRPALPPSPSEAGRSSGSIVSGRSSWMNLRTRSRQMPPSPKAENDSPSGLTPARRCASAGMGTRSIPNGDDGPENTSNQAAGEVVHLSLGVPSPPTAAQSELSSLPTPPTPSPISRRINSAPEVLSLSNPGRRSSPTEKWSTQKLDQKLAELVERPLGPTDAKNTTKGSNYVFTILDPNGQEKNFVKVGFSKDATWKRQYQIQSTCKLLIRQELNPNQRPIRLYKRAEALIKAELHNTIHDFECPYCRTKHIEYFAVPADVALELTRRWTGFCEKEPWDENGNLHPFWAERLSDREACSDNEDHKRRAERWKWFANASLWDRIEYNVSCLVYLICVTFPDAWIILVGWVLHLFILFDMMLSNARFITMFSQRQTPIHKKASPKNSDPSEGGDDFTMPEEVEVDVFGDGEILEPQQGPRQEMDID